MENLGSALERGRGEPSFKRNPAPPPDAQRSACEIEPDRLPVDHPPFAPDHHPVGAVCAAQNQRGQRIVRAGETRLVEREQARDRPRSLPRSGRCPSARGSAPIPRSPSAARRDA